MRKPFTYPLAGTPCARGGRAPVPQRGLRRAQGIPEERPPRQARRGELRRLSAERRRRRAARPDRRDAPQADEERRAVRGDSQDPRAARGDRDRARAEEQYRAIFNAVADSLVLRDADFRVVDVNPAYTKMSGRPREEALGRSDLTMSPPELTEQVRAMHARALAGEPVMFEALARRKDGSRFDIETRGVPILHQGAAARALYRPRHYRAQALPRSCCARARSSTARSSPPRPTRWCCATRISASSTSTPPTKRSAAIRAKR